MPRRYIARHQPRETWPYWLKAGTGGAVVFTVAWLLGDLTGATLIMAPLGASTMLVLAVPESPFAQPANVVGGHLIAGAMGILADRYLPSGIGTLALTVAAVIIFLGLIRLTHPPAGGTAVLVMLTHPDWNYLVSPVLAGTITLIIVAVLLHSLPPRAIYPLPLPCDEETVSEQTSSCTPAVPVSAPVATSQDTRRTTA